MTMASGTPTPKRRQRCELRADDHGTHHGDRGIGDHPDDCDEAGQGEKGQEGHRQLGIIPGARDELVPHHRIGGIAGCGDRGSVRGIGEHGVQRFESDPADMVDTECTQVG
jgi:hypothetical protein